MKAAFLIRCSTKNQDLDRQTRDLTRLAKSLGYEYDIENLVFGEKITGKDDVTIKMYLANLHTSFLCNLIYPTFSRILLYSC